MNLKSIFLNNFRSHEKLELKFGKNLNILTGKNASGKTNILEAIFFLATTRSHRTAGLKDLISWDKENFYIKAEVQINGSIKVIEAGCPRVGKRVIKLNNNEVYYRKDIVGQLPVVFFSPEDLYMVKEEPSFRRKFLDIFMSQVKPGYIATLQKYQQVISERNKALMQVKTGLLAQAGLEIWDDQAVKYGVEIASKRKAAVFRLNDICGALHEEMTGGAEKLSLDYDTVSAEEEMFRQKIKEKKALELEQGISLVGPHRDDILICIDGASARRYGSQGQQRTAALSMKLGEFEAMKELLGDYPLILFDDVLSELDGQRQKYFLNLLLNKGNSIQALVTTTELGVFETIREELNIIEI